MGTNAKTEEKTKWLDPSEWYQDPAVQSQVTKSSNVSTPDQSELVGEGFGASDNITLEDPNDRAIRLGLIDDDPFKKTDSSGAGIAGGIAGGLMDIGGLGLAAFAASDKDSTVDAFRATGTGNFYKGWKATVDWLKGAGSKAERDYYWHGTIPEGYEEDENGELVKKKTAVKLEGYEASGRSGSGFS
jgi:hypothetical protein